MTEYVPRHIRRAALKAGNRRRRIRTAVQSFVSACAVLVVAVPVALELLVGHVDPKTYAALVAVAVPISQGARVVTAFMQAPPVKQAIDRYLPWLAESDA